MVLQAGFADLQPRFCRPGCLHWKVSWVSRGRIFSHLSCTKVFISFQRCFTLCNRILVDRQFEVTESKFTALVEEEMPLYSRL